MAADPFRGDAQATLWIWRAFIIAAVLLAAWLWLGYLTDYTIGGFGIELIAAGSIGLFSIAVLVVASGRVLDTRRRLRRRLLCLPGILGGVAPLPMCAIGYFLPLFFIVVPPTHVAHSTSPDGQQTVDLYYQHALYGGSDDGALSIVVAPRAVPYFTRDIYDTSMFEGELGMWERRKFKGYLVWHGNHTLTIPSQRVVIHPGFLNPTVPWWVTGMINEIESYWLNRA